MKAEQYITSRYENTNKMNLYNTLELFYILNKGKHINLLSNIYKMFKLKLVVEADNTFNLATLKSFEILCFLAR